MKIRASHLIKHLAASDRFRREALLGMFSAMIFISVFISAFSGCASSPELAQLPEQTLDRKPVLPHGVTSWRALSGLALDSERNWTLFPFHWEQAISPRVTLVWTPLPFEVRFLAHSDEEQWLTTAFALLGSSYSRQKNWGWWPYFQAIYSRKLSPTVAWEEELLVQFEVRKSGEDRLSQTVGLRTSLGYQLAPRFHLKPGAWVLNETGEIRARYVGRIPPGNTGTRSQSARWRMPLALDLSWTLDPQWEMQTSLNYFSFGYEAEGFTSGSIFITAIHYW